MISMYPGLVQTFHSFLLDIAGEVYEEECKSVAMLH